MKSEVGMYVRTKRGQIGKIITIGKDNVAIEFNKMWQDIIPKENIVKEPSFDIADLIEDEDILLLFDKEYGEKYKAEVVTNEENFKTISNYEQDTLLNLEYELIINERIELLEILTKEQFEQMAYKVDE